jgi:hypothetical protein
MYDLINDFNTINKYHMFKYLHMYVYNTYKY